MGASDYESLSEQSVQVLRWDWWDPQTRGPFIPFISRQNDESHNQSDQCVCTCGHVNHLTKTTTKLCTLCEPMLRTRTVVQKGRGLHQSGFVSARAHLLTSPAIPSAWNYDRHLHTFPICVDLDPQSKWAGPHVADIIPHEMINSWVEASSTF